LETGGANQASAVDAEGRSEVSCFVEIVLEALAKRVAIRSDEVRFHFRLADHAVPDQSQRYLSESSRKTGETPPDMQLHAYNSIKNKPLRLLLLSKMEHGKTYGALHIKNNITQNCK